MPGLGMTVAEIAAIGGLCLNILVAVVGATWGVSKLKDAIRQEIQRHLDKVDQDIDGLRRETGETVAALRQKITEVELWNRDTFVRRDSFYKMIDDFGKTNRSALEKIDARLERMEAKIDSRVGMQAGVYK